MPGNEDEKGCIYGKIWSECLLRRLHPKKVAFLAKSDQYACWEEYTQPLPGLQSWAHLLPRSSWTIITQTLKSCKIKTFVCFSIYFWNTIFHHIEENHCWEDGRMARYQGDTCSSSSQPRCQWSWLSSVCKSSCDCKECSPGWKPLHTGCKCKAVPPCEFCNVSGTRKHLRNTSRNEHTREASPQCGFSCAVAGWSSWQKSSHTRRTGTVSNQSGPACAVQACLVSWTPPCTQGIRSQVLVVRIPLAPLPWSPLETQLQDETWMCAFLAAIFLWIFCCKYCKQYWLGFRAGTHVASSMTWNIWIHFLSSSVLTTDLSVKAFPHFPHLKLFSPLWMAWTK